jgi:hypothetical protein
MRVHGSTHSLLALLASVLIASFGSGCADTPTSASYSPGLGPVTGTMPGMGAMGTGPLASNVIDAMDRAIQDEYHAEQIYSRVLEDFGNVLPFANVVYAETRHSESIARIYLNHEIAAPESLWNRDNVPRFRSVPEACAAAAVEEQKNISMYDELLRLELPDDVERVMTTNREASLSSHLPAFRLCAGE